MRHSVVIVLGLRCCRSTEACSSRHALNSSFSGTGKLFHSTASRSVDGMQRPARTQDPFWVVALHDGRPPDHKANVCLRRLLLNERVRRLVLLVNRNKIAIQEARSCCGGAERKASKPARQNSSGGKHHESDTTPKRFGFRAQMCKNEGDRIVYTAFLRIEVEYVVQGSQLGSRSCK